MTCRAIGAHLAISLATNVRELVRGHYPCSIASRAMRGARRVDRAFSRPLIEPERDIRRQTGRPESANTRLPSVGVALILEGLEIGKFGERALDVTAIGITLPARIWRARGPGHGADMNGASNEIHQALRGAARHDLLQLDAGALRERLCQQMPECSTPGET